MHSERENSDSFENQSMRIHLKDDYQYVIDGKLYTPLIQDSIFEVTHDGVTYFQYPNIGEHTRINMLTAQRFERELQEATYQRSGSMVKEAIHRLKQDARTSPKLTFTNEWAHQIFNEKRWDHSPSTLSGYGDAFRYDEEHQDPYFVERREANISGTTRAHYTHGFDVVSNPGTGGSRVAGLGISSDIFEEDYDAVKRKVERYFGKSFTYQPETMMDRDHDYMEVGEWTIRLDAMGDGHWSLNYYNFNVFWDI